MSTPPTKPLIGTLYLDAAGDAYRLRGYGTDWENPDNPDPEAIPNYAILRTDGSMNAVHELPATAELIWTPDTEVLTHGARPQLEDFRAPDDGSDETAEADAAAATYLRGGDPDCDHDIVDATGGGVRCQKCAAWYWPPRSRQRPKPAHPSLTPGAPR